MADLILVFLFIVPDIVKDQVHCFNDSHRNPFSFFINFE